ncbi:hypothetical protein D3C71_1864490 [compost metagenome]
MFADHRWRDHALLYKGGITHHAGIIPGQPAKITFQGPVGTFSPFLPPFLYGSSPDFFFVSIFRADFRWNVCVDAQASQQILAPGRWVTDESLRNENVVDLVGRADLTICDVGQRFRCHDHRR